MSEQRVFYHRLMAELQQSRSTTGGGAGVSNPSSTILHSGFIKQNCNTIASEIQIRMHKSNKDLYRYIQSWNLLYMCQLFYGCQWLLMHVLMFPQ